MGQLRRAGRTDVQAATALAAVTRLAEFSGVGAQTTYGAGSVRIVRNRQPATG